MKELRGKTLLCLLAAILLAISGVSSAVSGVASADQLNAESVAAGASASGHTSLLKELDGKRIGIQTGTTFDEIVLATLPNVTFSYYNMNSDLAAALKANKIDAYPGDEPVLRLMAAEDSSLMVLEEYLDSFEFGFVLPKTEKSGKLLAEINEWLAGIRASGELEQIKKKWTEGPESEKTIPDYASLPAPKGQLILATEGGYAPMNYYRGSEVVGMEIELAARFCEAYGYGLTIEAMNFDGILPAVQAGKADFAAAGISITDERRESVNFSDPYYVGGTMMTVLRSNAVPAVQSGAFQSLDELKTARIGIPSGTNFDRMMMDAFPDAQMLYYANQSDLLMALSTNKIDAFPSDEPVIAYIAKQRDDITYIPEYIEMFEFAYCFAKTPAGEKLCGELSEFIRGLKDRKELDAITDKWFSADESIKTLPDIDALPATNGTLVMATDGDYMPFEYIRDGKVVGYDVDIAAQFCEAYGYGLRVEVMNMDAILPAVQSGKCNFGGSAITITAERAESVIFSEPNYSGGTVMTVSKVKGAAQEGAASQTITAAEDTSFLGGIVTSFNKTFIREDRWKLFVDGVLTTLLITFFSILLGTALGFLVFMLCRNGNMIANGVTRFSMWLVQGMPMVVLLMILYYIIFGSVAINGITVAVIGFTLTFGSSVFGLLKMGVGAIDPGQYEAAYALGYSNRRTFFRIILPQAIPHILPAYKGEIVGLIKATAIVGYIAVQDLTKMGDIVRSRTYEAFFPLIAITVIYFVLEGLFGLLVSRIQFRMNPKKRRRETILKGVDIHD